MYCVFLQIIISYNTSPHWWKSVAKWLWKGHIVLCVCSHLCPFNVPVCWTWNKIQVRQDSMHTVLLSCCTFTHSIINWQGMEHQSCSGWRIICWSVISEGRYTLWQSHIWDGLLWKVDKVNSVFVNSVTLAPHTLATTSKGRSILGRQKSHFWQSWPSWTC